MDFPKVVNRNESHTGPGGEDLLVTGKNLALRRWEESAGDGCSDHRSPYETVGYLLSGKLQLRIDGQIATMEPGDSWIVPSGAEHSYQVLEDIVAIEATSPPARFTREG